MTTYSFRMNCWSWYSEIRFLLCCLVRCWSLSGFEGLSNLKGPSLTTTFPGISWSGSLSLLSLRLDLGPMHFIYSFIYLLFWIVMTVIEAPNSERGY